MRAISEYNNTMVKQTYNQKRPNIPAEIKRSVCVEAGHACAIKNCTEHTYLEIHHIDENRENNALENLILLCDKHHKMAHKKVINRKDLLEYKKRLVEMDEPKYQAEFQATLKIIEEITNTNKENSEIDKTQFINVSNKGTSKIEAKKTYDFLKFQTAIETTSDKEIKKELKNKPDILYWTFCRSSGHDRYVLENFPIGELTADFVILNSYSGLWEVFFIDLTPVSSSLFTKTGEPSKALISSFKKVDSWEDYLETKFDLIRYSLVKWAKEKDLLKYSLRRDPCNQSDNYLKDTNTVLEVNYCIVMGRRSELTSKEHSMKARYKKRHNVEILSYDRILDIAKERYR